MSVPFLWLGEGGTPAESARAARGPTGGDLPGTAGAAPAQCPLCGAAMTAQDEKGCAACPAGSGCGTYCCPSCGYSFAERSGTWDFLTGLLRRIRGRRGHPGGGTP